MKRRRMGPKVALIPTPLGGAGLKRDRREDDVAQIPHLTRYSTETEEEMKKPSATHGESISSSRLTAKARS